MSEDEISRADVFSDISQKKISKTKAAEILGISTRHIRRLYREYIERGLTSLISRQRGKASNHQLPPGLKAQAAELVTIDLYADFGPKFMCEKLSERHGIHISVEMTRKIMIENGVWEVHKKKRPVIHQQRKRRAHFGELTQIDGSPHAWFEDRGDPCVLIVFIDDATGQTYGRFFPSETTQAYMITCRLYILKYGRPVAYYSDRHSIFRINRPGCLKKDMVTQFARACKELDIATICARSPQAKGRVERQNRTQQDRLIKELRLAGISTIEEANRFLDEGYWDKHNSKFAVPPMSSVDRHRKLLPEHNLKKILCHKEQRTLSKNLELQYENTIYQIVLQTPFRSLWKAKVTVIKGLEGELSIEYKGKSLPFKKLCEQEFKGIEIDSKEIDAFLNEKKRGPVPNHHPWKQEGRAVVKMKEFQTL